LNDPEKVNDLYEISADIVNKAIAQDEAHPVKGFTDGESRIRNIADRFAGEMHIYLAESDPRRLKNMKADLINLGSLVLRVILIIRNKLPVGGKNG
jgi:hypothetical protein